MENIFSTSEKLRIFKYTIVTLIDDIEHIKTRPDDSLVGLCWHLTNAAEELGVVEKGMEVGYNMSTYFPELYKRKPKLLLRYSPSYWFPRTIEGMEKRIKVLERLIKELEAITA